MDGGQETQCCGGMDLGVEGRKGDGERDVLVIVKMNKCEQKSVMQEMRMTRNAM